MCTRALGLCEFRVGGVERVVNTEVGKQGLGE